MEKLLEKIHSVGYWRVNIRPTVYEQHRIPSLAECREVIETSPVLLRGWDYPHVEPEGAISGEEWIESCADFMGNIEYWRFYQSAQFIHHLAVREDHELDTPAGSYLAILNTLYLITEIFEFASRLVSKKVLSPGIGISIGLIGAKGRELFFWNQARLLRQRCVSSVENITFARTYDEAQLLGHSAKHALDAVCWIFERFNWVPVPREILVEDQKKLLERRL